LSKRVGASCAAFLVAAVAATVFLVTTASGQSSGVVTFKLIEKNQAFHFVDNPPAATKRTFASQGDQIVIKSALLSPQMKPSGTLVATCTFTSGGNNGISTCFGTFMLKGGQLEGVTSMNANSRVTHIAIVGGTGAYVGARGEVTSVSRGENSSFSDDTVRLLP